MFDPEKQEDRLLFLFNSFAGSVHNGPWSVQKCPHYFMDSFGNSIEPDELCLVRGSGGPGSKPRRLSMASALRVWELLIADNGREQDFVESMRLAARDAAKDEAEAEAESYEDAHDTADGDPADDDPADDGPADDGPADDGPGGDDPAE